jgi:hypothetical protein
MENTYPKTVKIENEELKKLLKEKSDLIIVGRAKSNEIEELEKQMDETEKELMAEEKKVNLDEFKEREKEITERMNVCIADINKVKADVFAKIKAETPQELRDKYEELKKQKEDKETERNKIALKAQKYTDKIIPIARKAMSEFLEDQYDDYDSMRLEDGEIVCSIFNHLEDWKDSFNKRKK